jgi:hypothetical protein
VEKTPKESVADHVRAFLGANISPPELIPDPATGQVGLQPASYKFDGVHAPEFERIARAASAASGIVPTPEDLTGEAMAMLQAQQQQRQGQQGQPAPGA